MLYTQKKALTKTNETTLVSEREFSKLPKQTPQRFLMDNAFTNITLQVIFECILKAMQRVFISPAQV